MRARPHHPRGRVCAAGLVAAAALLSLPGLGAGVIRPHVIDRVHYDGDLGDGEFTPDQVVVFKQFPPGVTVLGQAQLVIADQTEPTAESAEALLKRVAARVGADAVAVEKVEDVSASFRAPAPDQPRGIAALREHEMAALVARAHLQGGELLIGRKTFMVQRADRFGDSDVTGPVTFTLSRTHDEREWRVGKAGPRYRAESGGRFITVVTGPSGTDYDVKIVGRRAKVFYHGRRELIPEDEDPAAATTKKKKELSYGRFTLKIGTFAKKN